MATAPLPVRFEGSSPGASLTLDPSRTALMVVDCDGDLGAARNAVVEERIAPALRRRRLDALCFHSPPGGEGRFHVDLGRVRRGASSAGRSRPFESVRSALALIK